jgi:hypothetical protein
VEQRITFFVSSAEQTATGWRVRGEAGLGPPRTGDEFATIQHLDPPQEDRVRLRIESATDELLTLIGRSDVTLVEGDILVGKHIRSEPARSGDGHTLDQP